jgi:maltooligosyltrehalose trehalohydrolase
MLFMGEEWGAGTPWQFFTSHPEPELGEATAKGRIAEFEKMGWDPNVVPDPQDPASFERSKLDWSELREPDHSRLFDLYRSLIALRKSIPALTDQSFLTVGAAWDESARWFRLDRAGVSVVVNFSDEEQAVPVVDAVDVALATGRVAELSEDALRLSANSAAVTLTRG